MYLKYERYKLWKTIQTKSMSGSFNMKFLKKGEGGKR